MSTTPIKRNEALKSFSRNHHHALMLCWKIREGIKLKVTPERIKLYVDWFWNTHLQQHFEEEEKYIFIILPEQNNLILQAKREHLLLKNLFENNLNLSNTLELIQKHLQDHVRFEERVLFNKIQEAATEAQLKIISELHHDNFNDDWKDEFWKT